MALTTNQLVVGMFNMAAGGYKTLVGDYMTAHGATATADTLLAASGLNPQFMGTNLLSNTDFASGLIGRVLSGVSSSIQSSIATIVSNYMTANPTLTRGAVVVAVLEAVLAVPTTDATLGTAVSSFTSKVALADASTSTSTDFTVLSQVVGGTGSTVTPGQTFTLTTGADMIDTNSAIMDGGKVTLTYKPGSGNDLFRALTSGDLTSSDMLDGSLGTDTLNAVQTSADAGVTIKPTLKAIELINFTVNAGTTNANSATLDLGDSTGVEEVTLKDALSVNHVTNAMTVNFNNVAAGVKVGINGGTKGSTGGVATNLTVGVKDADTNTADALTINLKDGLANVVTVANVEAITLNNSNTTATKSSTIAALTADKLKTLNIDGSGTLTVTALTGTGATLTNVNIAGSGKNTITTATATQTALKTIDASTATGNNTVVISGTAIANTTVKMGLGNDTVAFDTSSELSTAKGTEGLITGGDGKDTIKITEAGFGATEAGRIAKATGFEVLDIAYAGATNTTSVTLDASAFTAINEFVFSGATVGKTGASDGAGTAGTAGSAAVTVTNVENTDAFVFSANQTGGAGVGAAGSSQGNSAAAAVFTAKVDGGTDVLNITLKASATDDTAKIVLEGAAGVTGDINGKAAITATNFETVNLVSSGKSATTWANANALTGGALSGAGVAGDAITLNNNGTLVITGDKHLDLTSGVGGTNVTVNAGTNFSGMLKVKTGSGNDILIGGSNDDLLEGGTGIDSYTGNAGKNTFKISTSDAGTTGLEKITDFKLGSGADVLDITPTAVIADITEANKVSVAGAITSADGADTLYATVSKGIISLSGNAVAKIDTVTELSAIFALVDGNGATEVGAIVMGGNTYVIAESGNTTVSDVIQLVGITTATGVSATAATGVIVIA